MIKISARCRRRRCCCLNHLCRCVLYLYHSLGVLTITVVVVVVLSLGYPITLQPSTRSTDNPLHKHLHEGTRMEIAAAAATGVLLGNLLACPRFSLHSLSAQKSEQRHTQNFSIVFPKSEPPAAAPVQITHAKTNTHAHVCYTLSCSLLFL